MGICALYTSGTLGGDSCERWSEVRGEGQMSPLLKSPPRRRVVWPWDGKGVFSLSSVLPVTKIVALRPLFLPCQELMWIIVSLYCCGMLGKGLDEHWCAMGCGPWLPGKACDLEGERRCGPGTEGSDAARLRPAWPSCLVRCNLQVGDGMDSSCSLEGWATFSLSPWVFLC